MLDSIGAHWVPEKRLFLENAGLDPARRFLYPDGRLICAGGIFEISWFLLDALRLHPDPAQQAMVLAALEGALDFAWHREHGGFFYFQDIESRPVLQLEGALKLWWVHAEAIYALLRAYEATRDEKWRRWLEVVDEYVFSHLPDPAHGEWFGYLDRAGRPTHTLKGNRYKGCFHIPRALWFSRRAIERINAA
jgi:N-acylglucosamine 2-epimerase